MIGLFQENGPCRIKNDSSGVTLNPFSWNEVANTLYIDQPGIYLFAQVSRTLTQRPSHWQSVLASRMAPLPWEHHRKLPRMFGRSVPLIFILLEIS
jgi:hypothetical protein